MTTSCGTVQISRTADVTILRCGCGHAAVSVLSCDLMDRGAEKLEHARQSLQAIHDELEAHAAV